MTKFTDYLAEAQFSDDDFTRVLSVIERRMPKLLGAKLFRYGGPGYVDTVGALSRVVYIFGNRAFGVRFKAGHVNVIDVWKSFADNGPSHSIDVHTLSASTLIGSIKKLADLIKHPQEGEHSVKSINESVELNEMAKRVGDDAFYGHMVDAYGEDGAASVSWAQIKTVADNNDVLIPAYIRTQKIGRGLWTSKPGTDAEETVDVGDLSKKADAAKASKVEKSTKREPILYIKVTAQDPDTKRFIPAGEVKQAQALYKQINASMEKAKPTEEEVRDPETLYGHLAQLTEMTCTGKLNALLVYGGPGTGKCLDGNECIIVHTKEELAREITETRKDDGHNL